MIAEHYSPKLASTRYQEGYFAMDGDQFPEDANLTHEVAGRIHEEDEARAKAQELADQFQQAVEVAVYGTWGFHGKEYIETFKVEPRPIFHDLRADLAALGV